MRLGIDTNVVLDVILERRPPCDASAAILSLASRDGCELLMPAHAAATTRILSRQTRRASMTGRRVRHGHP
ncbi:PIN domain-containing protein [Bifidobacterium sp.]|uniref:PIN domain-containing protein n=1 Tax=Bifidobacterium sp. TaxID=41200 RepID=UPI003425B1B0